MDGNKDAFPGRDAFIKCHTEQDWGIIAARGYTPQRLPNLRWWAAHSPRWVLLCLHNVL